MAVTRTEQISAYPPGDGTGDDWLNDGEGMHTLVPLDLVRGLNNLASYCQPWAQYVQMAQVGAGGSTDPNGEAIVTPAQGTGEYMVMQFPICVPPGAIAMNFTAGVSHCSGSSTGTITGLGIYLSLTPYTISALNNLFDASGLSTVSGNRIAAGVSASIVNSNSYTLLSGTVIGYDDAVFTDGSGMGAMQMSNLIITLACSSPAALVMGIKDFTCWFVYE